jgi:hypothetical protein
MELIQASCSAQRDGIKSFQTDRQGELTDLGAGPLNREPLTSASLCSLQPSPQPENPSEESAVITMLGVSVLVGTLTVMPTKGSPVERDRVAQWGASGAAQAAPATVATHATKGVVKSIDATSLVITRSGRKAKEQTFAMDAATHQVGSVTVGATVEVRYRTADGHRVATVVSVQESRPQR